MGPADDPGEVTRILGEMREGDESAAARLFPLVYSELRALAGALFRRERAGHTLQPTAVVHEAWIRLAGGKEPDYRDRTHFLAVAARAMRQVLVDHARGRDREKRGGQWQKVTLAEDRDAPSGPEGDVEILALNDALEALAQLHERQARIVELRYFGGLSVPEAAEVLGVATRTVEKDWTMAKAWLLRALRGGRA